jgi:hypothetical protein
MVKTDRTRRALPHLDRAAAGESGKADRARLGKWPDHNAPHVAAVVAFNMLLAGIRRRPTRDAFERDHVGFQLSDLRLLFGDPRLKLPQLAKRRFGAAKLFGVLGVGLAQAAGGPGQEVTIAAARIAAVGRGEAI